ncbi:MAG: hypothetical protein AAGA05_09495 [Pseudomonadota bacterium]
MAPSDRSLRNASLTAASAQASQSAPDLKSGVFEIKGVSALDNSGLSVSLLDKARLHFLAGPDQPFGGQDLLVTGLQVRILPGSDLFFQAFDVVSELANGILQRLQQLFRARDLLVRGNHSHLPVETSHSVGLRPTGMKNGRQDRILRPLPMSSSMP